MCGPSFKPLKSNIQSARIIRKEYHCLYCSLVVNGRSGYSKVDLKGNEWSRCLCTQWVWCWGRRGYITQCGRAASQTPRACVVASLRGVMPD